MRSTTKDHLRRKRLWTVSDFATWMEISPKAARALLKRLDVETGGMLLLKSGGKKPEYSFFPAALAKAKPELFERVADLEGRVSDLEEQLDSFRREHRMIAMQTGQNSRDIGKLKASRAA